MLLRHARPYLAGFLATLLALTRASADDTAPATAPALDAKALEVLDRVSAFYKGIESCTVTSAMKMTIQAGGAPEELAAKHAVAMRRPNQFSARLLTEGRGVTAVSNGKDETIFVALAGEYIVKPAAPDFDAMPGMEGMNESDLGVMLIERLIGSNPRELLLDGVTRAEYKGEAEVNGKKCQGISLEDQAVTWEIWAADGEQALVQKAVPRVRSLEEQFRQAQAHAPGSSIHIEVLFTDWALNPSLAADQFEFTPPASAKKIEIEAQEEPDSPVLKLKGQPAPDFTLLDLEGKSTTLSGYKGKQVVLLDFWATWCPPCRKSLPIISRIAEEYKAKGVVFHAINQQETADEVRAFLKSAGLNAPMLLDADGAASEAFGVQYLPTSLIIGKDGVVAAVHQGAKPDLEKALRQELDAALGPAPDGAGGPAK